MFSLVYPSEPAPLLGTMVNNAEMMPVTEPGGLVVGRACRDFKELNVSELVYLIIPDSLNSHGFLDPRKILGR